MKKIADGDKPDSSTRSYCNESAVMSLTDSFNYVGKIIVQYSDEDDPSHVVSKRLMETQSEEVNANIADEIVRTAEHEVHKLAERLAKNYLGLHIDALHSMSKIWYDFITDPDATKGQKSERLRCICYLAAIDTVERIVRRKIRNMIDPAGDDDVQNQIVNKIMDDTEAFEDSNDELSQKNCFDFVMKKALELSAVNDINLYTDVKHVSMRSQLFHATIMHTLVNKHDIHKNRTLESHETLAEALVATFKQNLTEYLEA